MNQLLPMRRVDGRWECVSVIESSGRKKRALIWPMGYCAGFVKYEKTELKTTPGLAEWHKKALLFFDKFHTDGHATHEEASRCYQQYALDMLLRLDAGSVGPQRCFVCGETTRLGASIPHLMWHVSLCKHHLSKEFAGLIFKKQAETEIFKS